VEKIRLLRKSPAVEVSETTPTSKYFQISLTLIEQKNRNFDLFGHFLQGPAKTIQILSILLNFGVKILDFDFLFSKALAYDEKNHLFSTSWSPYTKILFSNHIHV
jgi:hypothetical protein